MPLSKAGTVDLPSFCSQLRFTGAKPDEAFFETQITELGKKLDVYEKILSKQKYLAGNEVTLADLFHLPYASLLPQTGSQVIEERPNVARWALFLLLGFPAIWYSRIIVDGLTI